MATPSDAAKGRIVKKQRTLAGDGAAAKIAPGLPNSVGMNFANRSARLHPAPERSRLGCTPGSSPWRNSSMALGIYASYRVRRVVPQCLCRQIDLPLANVCS